MPCWVRCFWDSEGRDMRHEIGCFECVGEKYEDREDAGRCGVYILIFLEVSKYPVVMRFSRKRTQRYA
jgi:hypothetical protein